MQTTFDFEIDDEVKHIEKGNIGRVDTCALDRNGLIYYVVFPEKHVSNLWVRPGMLKKVE